MIFVSFARGLQTWEYASQYALRTYAYLLPMQGLSRFYEHVFELLPNATIELLARLLVDHPVLSSKVWAFCCLRSTLAAFTALAEVLFCRALEKRFPETCWITCVLMLTSAGMGHAAGAYLPSSSVLMLFLAALAFWWNQNHVGAMACAVVATLAIGWPFCAVLFVPMGLHVLYQNIVKGSFTRLLLITIVWTLLVQGAVMVIDHHYYGRWVSPLYNIFAYNAQGGGDELYGVEPASYYVKNLLLNFNYVALLAFPSPLLVVIRWRFTKVDDDKASMAMLLVTLAPLFLWLAIVVPRPHKEERFLFPIYPLLCAGAAITLDCMWDVTVGNTKKRLLAVPKLAWCILVCLPACLVSSFRTGALSTYYTAPLSLYAELQQHSTPDGISDTSKMLVCTCGEWYRFPSSYYLPPNHELGFLPSSFRGQLPHPFTEFGSKPEGVSLGGNFNDQNLEEADRYVSSIDACSFVVELVSSSSSDAEQECLHFMGESSGTWSKVAERPYLDAALTSILHRILYVPYIHQRAIEAGSVQYNSYVLYKNNK